MDIPVPVERSGSNIHNMHPRAIQATAGRLSSFYDSLRSDPKMQHHTETAKGWYPGANALAQEISPGNTPRGAGIVAALSPGTEWEKNKRMAQQIEGYHPDLFTQGEEIKQQAIADAGMTRGSASSIEAAGREAKAAHYEKYGVPDLAAQSEDNLTKAWRISQGETPMEGPYVASRAKQRGVLGGPKVRSFYGNILDPEDPEPVTIDTHAHDAAVGMKLPYAQERGLSSAGRYNSFATAYRGAAQSVGIVPSEMQAAVWTGWKDLKGDWSDEERMERMGV